MSRRPVADESTGQSSRRASVEIARAYLFELDVDRQKRIDRYIDYFGSGAGSPTAGESPLASDGAR